MACPPRIVAGSDFIPMSKKRHRPPRARPRIVDRIQLAMSLGRHLDGIWIGSWRGTPEVLTRVEGALRPGFRLKSAPTNNSYWPRGRKMERSAWQ